MERTELLSRIRYHFEVNPCVALLGPRQCGKTTLAREYAEDYEDVHYFDLEDPDDLALFVHPKRLLETLDGLIVIDEVQRIPELFPLLRVLVDKKRPRKFLILGSASRDLLRQSSETLAGRISYLEIPPFSYAETRTLKPLWLRGGFPRAFLAHTDRHSMDWRKNYIANFLERDIPALGIHVPPENLRRFWQMLAHYHGNLMNYAELGRSLGISSPTIRNYLDILSGTLMIRILAPWFENIGKRQVKSPKVYFRDSGILHTLLGCALETDLLRHPKLGASWEGFALEEIIRHHRADPASCFFWRTQSGSELDLMITADDKRHGFEFKFGERPKLTSSMMEAKAILKLDSLSIIHPGQGTFEVEDGVYITGLEDYLR